jgi:uncharacterized protein
VRAVFVDTNYFVALIHPQDQWHQQAINSVEIVKASHLVTTDSVLIELLNFFSKSGDHLRRVASTFVRDLLADPDSEIVPHTRESLFHGLNLYESRLDKGYSLTDCISMTVARERGITEVLTRDQHFQQEGFRLLL